MWYELSISNIPPEKMDALNALLETCEVAAVTMLDAKDEPLYEPALHTTPLWKDTRLNVLCENEELRLSCMQRVKMLLPEATLSLSDIQDKVWEREWLLDFKPMRFGKRLWVCPTHIASPDDNAITLFLDPGLAFGTGTHETTALCLTYLDGAGLRDKTICDYGAGSGILAIAALKLGAKKAYCVDIDSQAIVATYENAKRNNIDTLSLDAFLVDEKPIPKVDLLIANILSGPLIELAARFSSLVNEKGSLVLSGILEAQTNSIIEAYTPYFKLDKSETKGDWACLIFSK